MGRRVVIAVAIDALLLLVFVAIGRSAHHHARSLSGLASTAWPFLVGLVVAWLVIVSTRRDGRSLTSGVLISVVTVAVAMVLRVVSGQGTDVAFTIVALCFVDLFLVAWRGVWAGLGRRAPSTSSGGHP